MVDVNTFMLMMLYVLGAILLVCLIVFVIKLISTINRVNGILDNVDNKISKLDNIFKIVDTMTDSLALFSDKLVDPTIHYQVVYTSQNSITYPNGRYELSRNTTTSVPIPKTPSPERWYLTEQFH